MGESRVELLSWLNMLTGIGVNKVELCGRGYPIAHIFDSIFGDMPMKKIDFNANTEVKFLANWKVIQTNMAKHRIEKIVPIDRLVKCKMQDNLEFLQWCKKYWDQYYPGGEYDAAGRRGGTVPAISSTTAASRPAPIRTTHSASSSNTASAATSSAPRRATGTASSSSMAASARTPSRTVSTSAQTVALQKEVQVLNETVAGLEKERDFYFNKLRDIEILIQTAADSDPAAFEDEGSMMKQIQDVLYSTEEGFEVPKDENELEEGLDQLQINGQEQAQDEDEVF